jgi:hypothetical protein
MKEWPSMPRVRNSWIAAFVKTLVSIIVAVPRGKSAGKFELRHIAIGRAKRQHAACTRAPSPHDLRDGPGARKEQIDFPIGFHAMTVTVNARMLTRELRAARQKLSRRRPTSRISSATRVPFEHAVGAVRRHPAERGDSETDT